MYSVGFIDGADIASLIEMQSNGKIPVRYSDKFFNRIEKSGQIDLPTATTLARNSDFIKLLELSKSKNFNNEIKKVFETALNTRFKDRYEEYKAKSQS